MAGTVLVSCTVLCCALLHLQNSDRLFLIPTGQAAALFLASLLSPLIVIEMGMVEDLLLRAHVATGTLRFSTSSLVEAGRLRFYPYTIVLFALLATEPLWLPIVIRAFGEQPWIEDGLPIRGGPSHDAFSYKALLIVAVAMSLVVGTFRVPPNYPLTGDAPYYLSVLRKMDQSGIRAGLSTDRPILFLILHSLGSCLSIGAEALLGHFQIALAGGLVASTYYFVSSYFKDKKLAVISAFFASVGPHLTIGINYFIVGNWLGLILMMIFYVAMLKDIEKRSQAWTILAIAISWLILGIHFPTWIFTILVLVVHTLICQVRRDSFSKAEASSSIKITIGSLLVVVPMLLLGLVAPETSTSVQHAWSRAVALLSRITPLNIASFFYDEVLLTSYFAYGGYAVPLTYALAILGLYSLYRTRRIDVKLILSWVTVSSVGLILIPKPEQWRLIYMMPLEILAGTGLVCILTSIGLLKDPPIISFGERMWPQAAILGACLLVGGALLTTSIPSLLIVSSFSLIGWLSMRSLSAEQVRQIAAAETVSLYVLASFAVALCTLR